MHLIHLTTSAVQRGCDLNLESLEPDHEPTHVMLWMYHFIKLSPLVPNFMRAPLSM